MIAIIIAALIAADCFSFGYIMNPTNTTEYNYSPEELWEPPFYWKNWEKNVPEKLVVSAKPGIGKEGSISN